MTQSTQQFSPPQDQTQPAAPLPSVHRLKSIAVVGGFLDGVRFDLANGLNCIIGARGTGKTTALELVRYAIDALPSREARPAEHKRIESLIQQNLAGGRVEVKVETKDGLEYTISRSWGEEPIVLTADGSPTAISVSFRQACMNLLEGCGIVGCQRRTLWRTADEYQEDTGRSSPTGGSSAAIRAVAADA